MAKYNNVDYLSQPQQVNKNREDIIEIKLDIDDAGVGPQGTEGPRGPQGVQGIDGPAGPDGTPVPGLTIDASDDGVLDGLTIILNDEITGGTTAIEFNIKVEILDAVTPLGLNIYKDDVLQSDKISVIDNFIVRFDATRIRMLFYNENGELTEYDSGSAGVVVKINAPSTGIGNWSLNEIVQGSTVGPTGPAGSQGTQGSNGATGGQGIQGLPGQQNLRFLAEFNDEDTFPEYDQRVLVQCVGGDYDGYTAIKEAMQETDTVKFGPYAVLVSIEDSGGTIQSILLNGVTLIRVYAVENLT